jgi:hypothetical protein
VNEPPDMNATIIILTYNAKPEKEMKNINIYEHTNKNEKNINSTYGEIYSLKKLKNTPVVKHPRTSKTWNVLLFEFELSLFDKAMRVALSSIILEIPMIIAKTKNTSQNSLLSLASEKDAFNPLVAMNLSVSLGVEIAPFIEAGLMREIAITGISKLSPNTRISILDPQ